MADVAKTIGQRIKLRRKELRLTLVQLAELVGVSHGFLSRLENDKIGISRPALTQLAQALETTVEELTGEEQPAPSFTVKTMGVSEEESALLTILRSLPRAERKAIFSVASSLAKELLIQPVATIATPTQYKKKLTREIAELREQEPFTESKLVPIRLLVDAAAGSPIDAVRQADEVLVPQELAGKDIVGVRARGDSMIAAGINDGDILRCRSVHESFSYQAGDVVVAVVSRREGEYELVVKRFAGTHRGMTRLLSENNNRRTIELPREQIRIDAVVTHRRVTDREWIEVARASVRGRK